MAGHQVCCPFFFPSAMLPHHRKSVSLLFTSTDLPLWSSVETVGTLYQKDTERFDLLLTEPIGEANSLGSLLSQAADFDGNEVTTLTTPRLLWLELSPYRVTLTMQGSGAFSYRHSWEQGVYGFSRYWLHRDDSHPKRLFLRNFTRNLVLKGRPLPSFFRVEYELWSETVQLGKYVLSLEIQ